ncbi:hypothetical protein PLEOSDRAFT_1025647, partial [Pleurotus ostreatus PC15]
NNSFKVDLPRKLIARGIHPIFHSSLPCIHIASDDRLFPGRSDGLFDETTNSNSEWSAKEIRSHSGSGMNAIFEIVWPTGDVTWLPYHQIEGLNVFKRYLEEWGVAHIADLPN